ncbi:HoxN/HupN/NixA family nickel/cobalt transporter [Microtetraspora malaysiensis]|uniref:HoxN/HupN/NixA family nickel/cobalt transporter n=1 Tax=Microtetraspora malaysiensis TaxID=161358 RepID=UPI000ACD53F7|nr:HoxN/HupN/NixA family nickel/cobalt transporter [Microtetraspora malaysiensis]
MPPHRAGTVTANSGNGITRSDWTRFGAIFAVIVLLHVAAWGTLLLGVLPGHYTIGSQVFGFGLGVTAYTLGLRHAFDADHLAAIDNTTRKLMNDGGRRPVSVGFWFALGHSSVVMILALVIMAGAHGLGRLTSDTSMTHHVLSLIGTSVSAGFLCLIGVLNLAPLIGIVKVFRKMRRGEFDEAELEARLDSRGFLNRFLGRLTRSIRHPAQMFPLGLLFGLGFDTATEVTMLVLAGTGAVGGLPWHVILVLPLLFAAGMTLLDTIDGTFMNFAYGWAFAKPARKVYYNITITGLSVAVALIIGSIELIGILRDSLGLDNAVTTWIAGLNLNNIGFVIVGLFVVVWAASIGYWHMFRLEERFTEAETSALGR